MRTLNLMEAADVYGANSSGGGSGSGGSGVTVQPGTGNVSCCSIGPVTVDIVTIRVDGEAIVTAVGQHEAGRRPGAGG